MKINGFKIIGAVALLLGGVSTILSEMSREQEMRQTVKEEVDKAFSEREEEESY